MSERRTMRSRVLALTLGAGIMLVPANALPVMFVMEARQAPIEPTIIGGVMLLMDDGLWVLAAIVFIASLVVPALKLVGLAVLLGATRRTEVRNPERLARIHTALESIGRWSMLDVFLVAFLCGAVRFGNLAAVEPRSGIVAFALAVVLTMLATRAVDPRLLWPETPALPEQPRPS